MRPEVREKFLALADESARSLGGSSFQEGIEITYNLCSRLAGMFDRVRTPEKLAQQLDQVELSKKDEWLLFGTMRLGPHLIRFCLRKLAERAEKDLPAPVDRRPSVPANTQYEMVRFMASLYLQKSVPIEICKQRAASRFGLGIRTVERYWGQRAEILENGPELRLGDVVEGLREVMSAPEMGEGQPLL